MLAVEECRLQGVLLSAVAGLPYRRRYAAEKLAAQNLFEFPQQSFVVGEEFAPSTGASNHHLPHLFGLGGCFEVSLRGLPEGFPDGVQSALGFLSSHEIAESETKGKHPSTGELHLQAEHCLRQYPSWKKEVQ